MNALQRVVCSSNTATTQLLWCWWPFSVLHSSCECVRLVYAVSAGCFVYAHVRLSICCVHSLGCGMNKGLESLCICVSVQEREYAICFPERDSANLAGGDRESANITKQNEELIHWSSLDASSERQDHYHLFIQYFNFDVGLCDVAEWEPLCEFYGRLKLKVEPVRT